VAGKQTQNQTETQKMALASPWSDLVSGEIVCCELTMDDVGNPTALPDPLDQIDGTVAMFIADGAYDGSPTRDLLETRLGEIVEVIIPPHRQNYVGLSGVTSLAAANCNTLCLLNSTYRRACLARIKQTAGHFLDVGAHG
jgi:hypothetical protein